MPTIDFSAVKDFEPLPKGEYTAALTKHEFGDSKQGQPKVKVQYTVSDPEEFAGRVIFKDYSLQAKALWVIKKHLVALGADPDEFAGDVDLDELLERLHGEEAIFDLDLKEGEGEYAGRFSNEILSVKERNLLGAFR